MKKIFIATARNVGQECIEWARQNTRPDFELIDNMQEADIIFSVLYDKIIPPTILKNKVCFNFHPGVLPEYKGAGSYSWVLINNEPKAGVTLHLIDSGIDTGDIIEIREFLISNIDTAHSLFIRGEQTILRMFKEWYHSLLAGKYIAVPQDPKQCKVYYKKELQMAKNLTRFAKAFYFPNKESAYYINQKSEKIYLDYIPKEEKIK
tara:strand:- start:103 stop:720 length:618 start_codon:yes stop_codon:yes gene_type:complete